MAILTREERNEILCLVFDNWRSPDLPTLTPEQIISLVMSKYDRLNNQYESVRSFVRRALREEIISIEPSAWTPNLAPCADASTNNNNTSSTIMSSLEAEVPKSQVSHSLRDAESTTLNDNDIGTSDDIIYENKIIAACYRTGNFLKYYIYPVADERYNSCRKRRTKIYKRLGEDGYNKYGTTDDTTGHKVIVNISAVDDEIINQLKEKTYMFTAASNDIGTNNRPNNSTVSNEYCTTLNGKPSADYVHLDASTEHAHQQEEERNDMQFMELERDAEPSSSDASGDMLLTGGSSPTTLSTAPSPPPSTPKVQLMMLQTLLHHRKVQIQKLPQRYLLSFANDIISDLTKSRYEQNQYSEGEQRKGWSTDLAIGTYSDLLLTGRVESSALAPNKISPDDIALHLLALAYRSMDDTLDSAMRKHGLDALQSVFKKLDHWLDKWTRDKERKKKNLNNWKKRLSPVDDEKKDVGGEDVKSSSPLEKRQKKSPPESLQATEITPDGVEKNSLMPVENREEGEISEQNIDPKEIEPTAKNEMKHSPESLEESNDKGKMGWMGEESSPEEGELKDAPKDSGLPVAMDTDPIGASIGRITLSPAEKNQTGNSAALDQTEVPKELLKSPPELANIVRPGPHDVLIGRGGGTNHYPGNKRFRQLICTRKDEYKSAKRSQKPIIAQEIVTAWRTQVPPGRFLKQDESTMLWHDVGDVEAKERAAQKLRDSNKDNSWTNNTIPELSGGNAKAPGDSEQSDQTGFVEMFTCDICKKAFPTYAEADVHEKECIARKPNTLPDTSRGSAVTSTQVMEKLNKSDNTETEDPKTCHDRLLEQYKNKKNFKGIELKKNSRRNNTVQAFHNATEYNRKFAITKVGDGTSPLTLVEAAYASDQAFVVEYCLHKARSNKSLESLFKYLNSFRESIPELAAFGARQVYSKQFHEFAGSFTGRRSLNFFDLESLNKAYKKEVKKRSLDLTGDEISFERRKDIFVAVVDAIIKKWKLTKEEMRVAVIEEMRNAPSVVQGPMLQQQQQQQVPRINPTEEELSDVIVI